MGKELPEAPPRGTCSETRRTRGAEATREGEVLLLLLAAEEVEVEVEVEVERARVGGSSGSEAPGSNAMAATRS